MIDAKEMFEDLKSQFGEEHTDLIMENMAQCTMSLIDFLAMSAGTDFETMCKALILTDKKTRGNRNE